LASRQGFGELKTEQLGGHSQEQQRHRQAPIDDTQLLVKYFQKHFKYIAIIKLLPRFLRSMVFIISQDYCRSNQPITSSPISLVTLTFDLLPCNWYANRIKGGGTLLPNLGMLGLWVLELFAMYATDGRTDRQKQRLLPLPYGRGNKIQSVGLTA